MTEQIQATRSNIAIYLPVALCCLAAVCEGLDLQAPGVAAPMLSADFNLSPDQTGFFLSMSAIGMMFGAPIGGRLSDYIGRKAMLIWSIVIYSVFSILTVYATNVEMLFWIRFAAGIGLGSALPNLVTLGVESVPQKRRSLAVGLILAGPGVGGALAGTVAAFAAEQGAWQDIFYVAGFVPLLIVVPLLLLFLPNSTGYSTEGNKIRLEDKTPGITSVLFGGGRLLRTMAVWLGMLCVLLVLYVVLSWLPTILGDRGLSGAQASIVQVLVNLFAIPGSIIAGVTLDYILKNKSYRFLIGFFLVAMLAIVVLAMAPATFSIMLIGGALVGITIIGTQTIIYALLPICYPTAGRGTGVGCGVAFGRFGAAGGPILTGYLVAFGLSSSYVLMSLLPVTAVAGGVALYLCKSISKEDSEENSDESSETSYKT